MSQSYTTSYSKRYVKRLQRIVFRHEIDILQHVLNISIFEQYNFKNKYAKHAYVIPPLIYLHSLKIQVGIR